MKINLVWVFVKVCDPSFVKDCDVATKAHGAFDVQMTFMYTT